MLKAFFPASVPVFIQVVLVASSDTGELSCMASCLYGANGFENFSFSKFVL